jgi:hypothetical protein
MGPALEPIRGRPRHDAWPALLLYALAAVLSLRSPPASAHHSAQMFEPSLATTLAGTIKEFEWTNPHSWLVLVAPDGRGGHEEWSLELGPLVGLERAGWKPRSLKSGDKVSVVFHPMRDGAHGGRLVSITLANGQIFDGSALTPHRPKS